MSHQEHLLEVCSEETIEEIKERYRRFNRNADQYIWKRLGNKLDMNKTLDENGKSMIIIIIIILIIMNWIILPLRNWTQPTIVSSSDSNP